MKKSSADPNLPLTPELLRLLQWKGYQYLHMLGLHTIVSNGMKIRCFLVKPLFLLPEDPPVCWMEPIDSEEVMTLVKDNTLPAYVTCHSLHSHPVPRKTPSC